MVQFIPARNTWSEAFQNIGGGLVKGYQDRSDENAIQNAVTSLGDNPTARQILNAVTGAKTHSPAAKQNFLKNYMGVEEFEEVKRKHLAEEETNDLKADLEKLKTEKKQKQEMNDALALIDASKLEQDEKETLRKKVVDQNVSYDAIKEILKPDKEEIKAKQLEEDKNRAQTVFNGLVDLIPAVGRSGIITSNFGGDTAKAFANFTSLSGGLESALVEMVNRGTLSNTRFNYITKTLLPKPSDTQAEIRGKLEGLAVMLDLDASALTGEKKQEKKENKAPEGKIKVRNKATGKTGTVTPYEGMDAKYERI